MQCWSAIFSICVLMHRVTALPSATPRARAVFSSGRYSATLAPIPTLMPRAPAGSGSATSYPVTVSQCYNYADPDIGAASGCQCENWDGILPYLSGSSTCGYSTISTFIPPPTTTNTFDTKAPYPYTMTMPNGALIAYASSSSIADAGPWQPWSGVGASTTVQIGTSLGVQIATNLSAQSIGTFTGDRLYTAISNALVTACPSPTSGSTVTACATPSPIKDIPYLSGSEVNTDGKLTLTTSFVQYSDPDILAAMIASVATAMNVSSLHPRNTEEVTYNNNPCYNCVAPSEDNNSMNLTRVPGAVQALIMVQDKRTSGSVEINQLQLQAQFHLDSFDELFCSAAAFAADSLGLLAIVPGLDFLAIGAAPAAFAFSFVCFMDSIA